MFEDMQILTETILREFALFLGVDSVNLATLLGLLFVFGGFSIFVTNSRLLLRGEVVNAEVVNFIEESGGHTGTMYTPVFRIIDGPFRSVECQSGFSGNWRIHKLGKEVTGIYDQYSNYLESIRIIIWIYIGCMIISYIGYVSVFHQ